MTPDPPKNLRASSLGTTILNWGVRLEWDPSTTGATEYYVYRTIINPLYANFYQTQRVRAVPPADPSHPPSSYIESGDPPNGACPDGCCGIYYGNSHPCEGIGNLEAYYVTARGASGGESPRSNLVFWKWGASGGGYEVVSNNVATSDAIASIRVTPPNESLACWITDQPDPAAKGNVDDEWAASGRHTELATEPMRSLGQVQPLWVVYDLHTDHLGSVRAITNSVGATVSRHDYFPFGVEASPQPPSYNTHQYTGHERDKETGLDYMLARYYGAGVGRFVSVDPTQRSVRDVAPQTWNRFSYALNNPINRVDPDGEASFLVARNGPGYAAHMFIVTHAQYIGDPNARIYSWGRSTAKGSSGKLARVDDKTGGLSKGTAATDRATWNALAKGEAKGVDMTALTATDGKTASVAESVLENKTYTPKTNSNSAAQAVGDRAQGFHAVTPDKYDSAVGTGNAGTIEFDESKIDADEAAGKHNENVTYDHEATLPKKIH
jgi:RHS repeat-associated protein